MMVDLFVFFTINIKEILYKPSPRHNNYIYKSKEDSSWYLFQVIWLY